MPWTAKDRERYAPEVQQGWVLLGAMVKRRRETIGWSQRDLGRRAGLDQSAISRLENGALSGIRFSRFAKLVAAMNGLDPASPFPVHRRVYFDW